MSGEREGSEEGEGEGGVGGEGKGSWRLCRHSQRCSKSLSCCQSWADASLRAVI